MPSEQICPVCGRAMVERTNRRTGGRFWGCTGFRSGGCRKTLPIYTAPPQGETRSFADFRPSDRQVKVRDFLLEQAGNAVVMARPGSGKTTLLEWLMSVLPTDIEVALLAFGRDIAKELKMRVRDRYVSTTHSLGLANIRQVHRRVKVEQYKVMNIIDNMASRIDNEHQKDELLASKRLIVRLVDLCKATMRQPTTTDLEWITDRYSIDVNGDTDQLFKWTRQAYERSLEIRDRVDFNDMIAFSALGLVPCKQFDLIGVDETQDLNAAQIALILKSVKPNGRILAVGDRFQSIYGFRGADVHAVDNIILALDAVTLPLDISYRLPKGHVEFINGFFPEDSHITARSDAVEGTIETMDMHAFFGNVKEGDLVVCRRNAPLVRPALELLRRGIKATILGRDIGAGLIGIIDKVARKHSLGANTDVRVFYEHLIDWTNRETARLERRGQGYKAATLADRVETIVFITDDCDTIGEVKGKIAGLFSDDRAGVTFSTVHKAKGKEAKNVYVLNPDELGSHPKATQEWEIKQEINIAYVAFSRSKKNMYLVSGA